jgi:hypothetical protein
MSESSSKTEVSLVGWGKSKADNMALRCSKAGLAWKINRNISKTSVLQTICSAYTSEQDFCMTARAEL